MSGSDYTRTPNYNLYKPTPNADDDVWGDHWNFNADTLDSIVYGIDTKTTNAPFLPIAGGTLTGNLGVPNGTSVAPSVALGAADGTGLSRSANFALITAQASFVCAFGAAASQFYTPLSLLNNKITQLGDATAAADALNLRTGDARYMASGAGPYAPLASPALTGTPTAPTPAPGTSNTTLATTAFVTNAAFAPVNSPLFTGDPRAPTPSPGDNDTSIATTAFVTAALGNVPGGAVIGDVAPTASPGALWWDSVGGNLYVRYQDPDSTSWVAATNMTGLANAATKDDVASSQQNVGRNKLHNSMFNVAQRGAGPFTVAGSLSLDRWSLYFNLDTLSIQQTIVSDGDRSQIGDEAAKACLGAVFTGNAGAAAQSILSQSIEDVRRVAGKTVIVSFWAKYTSGTPRLGICLAQAFGYGGSPSATTYTPATPVTLSAAWQRYSVSVVMPSVSGRTFGTTAGTDFTQCVFVFSHGASLGSTYGNVGVQSGTIALWGIQLEIAQPGQTQPTPLEKPDPVMQLQQCQRFYATIPASARFSASAAGQIIHHTVTWPPMRAAPTAVLVSAGTSSNATSIAMNTPAANGGYFTIQSVAAGDTYVFASTYSLSADL